MKPLLVNNTLLFHASRGNHVHEFGRTQEAGYTANDVSLRSAQLFDGYDIVDSAL